MPPGVGAQLPELLIHQEPNELRAHVVSLWLGGPQVRRPSGLLRSCWCSVFTASKLPSPRAARKSVRCQPMSLTGQTSNGEDPEGAVIVVNFPMPAGFQFDWHTHKDHQLAWAPRGVLTVVTEAARFILPPTRALWIPVALRHETRSTSNATMRALYIKPAQCSIVWSAPTAVAISPLLAELIGYLNDGGVSGPSRANAEALLVGLLSPVPIAAIDVRLPTSHPASKVADALIAEPARGSTLVEWGQRVGASERTLARSFLAETGLPFGRWRTLVRLQAALTELATGRPVAAVALQVGYETTSAFVAAFRRETGLTPGNYFRDAGTQPSELTEG